VKEIFVPGWLPLLGSFVFAVLLVVLFFSDGSSVTADLVKCEEACGGNAVLARDKNSLMCVCRDNQGKPFVTEVKNEHR